MNNMGTQKNIRYVIIVPVFAFLFLFSAAVTVTASSIGMCFLDTVVTEITPEGEDSAQVEFRIQRITDDFSTHTPWVCDRFDIPGEIRSEQVAFSSAEERDAVSLGDSVVLLFRHISSHPTPDGIIHTSSSWSFIQLAEEDVEEDVEEDAKESPEQSEMKDDFS